MFSDRGTVVICTTTAGRDVLFTNGNSAPRLACPEGKRAGRYPRVGEEGSLHPAVAAGALFFSAPARPKQARGTAKVVVTNNFSRSALRCTLLSVRYPG